MVSAMDMVYTDLSKSLGAIQIGSIFGIFLLGVLSSQCYYYYVNFWKKDARLNKILVALVWALEMAHTGCACYEVYRTTITLYGQPQMLTTLPALASTTATGGAITLLVQTFLAKRITHTLPRPYCLGGWLCIVLGFVRFAGTVFLSNYAMNVTDMSHYAGNHDWLITATLSLGAAIDVAIALSMVWCLTGKRREGLGRITAMADKLMEYTIRTGALTSVWAIILLIIFQTMPGDWAWLAVYMVLAKSYSTSLLASLNSRVEIRDQFACSPPNERAYKHRPRSVALHHSSSSSSPSPFGAISIEMNTTTTQTPQADFKRERDGHTQDDLDDRAYGDEKHLHDRHAITITRAPSYRTRATNGTDESSL